MEYLTLWFSQDEFLNSADGLNSVGFLSGKNLAALQLFSMLIEYPPESIQS